MDTTVKGLILKSTDYKEADKLLTILTLEKGKIYVRARGVKKSTSKLKAFCQSFCFGDFELVTGKSGFVLSGINCIDNFFEITKDLDKFSKASATIEILDKICAENESYPQLFIDALKCLKTIAYTTVEPRLVLSKFIIDTLKLEGFCLNLDVCSRCRTPLVSNIYFNLSTGEILCSACRTFESIEIEKSVFSTFKILSQNDYDQLRTIKIPTNILDKTLNVLAQNLSYKYEIKLNSLKL
jgi:DNA repair protein RecO (recombination protein O)